MPTAPTPKTYAELQQAYNFFNERLFENRLPDCLITLQREKRAFGYFSSARFVTADGEITDEIAMNPSFFGVRKIKDTLSVLVHEMVHLDQQHNGAPGRGRYHNLQWAKMMEAMGLMPSSTGAPGGDRVGDKVSHYIIKDGLFDQICDKLITANFRISWLDRFPPFLPPQKPTYPRELSEYELTRVNEDLQQQQEKPLELSPALESIGIEVQPVNRSNRTKYRCPGCKQQVWGKPGLGILCGNKGMGCFGLQMRVVK